MSQDNSPIDNQAPLTDPTAAISAAAASAAASAAAVTFPATTAPGATTPPVIVENPYQLTPNDNPSSVIIDPPLSGLNYITWNRAMTLATSVKNKFGFLDGSIPTPDLGDPLYSSWLRCNNLLLTWILNSVSKEIAASVLYINSAKDVWDTLKQRYSQPDNVRIFHLQQIMNCMTQGTLNVTEYFTALNAVWEEMRSYRPSPFCSCGHCTCLALKSVGETQMVDLTFKFLMGLNESFEGIRGQILMLSPIPSLDKAFSMVLQDERQREARIIAQPPIESSALAVNSSQSKRKFNSNVVCEHCSRTGHTKDSCYRLIGFPADFKFTKSKQNTFKPRASAPPSNTMNHGFANNVQVPTDQTVVVQGNPIDNEKLGLTPIQLQRLIKYLEKDITQPSSSNDSNKDHSANAAGFDIDDWSF